MGLLAKFFGGMSLTGYVITFLVTALTLTGISLAWALHLKDKAENELAGSEQAILQLVENTVHHQKEIDRLIGEVEQCANKRAAAEQTALEVERELHRLSVIVEESTNERVQEVTEAVEASEPRCDCSVPPRVTRLLIDAACDANRDTNCP